MQNPSFVFEALSKVKLSSRMDEDQIHTQIMKMFDCYGISYEHECKIVPHKRFDFWIDGIVVEVKKRKPSKITLLNQLNKYTKSDKVKMVIVVLEESMDLPRMLNEKPIFCLSLNINWGIAI